MIVTETILSYPLDFLRRQEVKTGGSLEDDVGKILITEKELKAKVAEIAEAISADYQDKDLLLVCILKGAVVFLGDLMRCISIPLQIDFMAISSYGAATKTSGVVRILKDLDVSIEGRDVLLVEDIIDTGLTLTYIFRNLRMRQPASLRTCVLLNKPERRLTTVPLDYLGFEIPDEFVVGYGLDYNGNYRHLRFVGVLKPESMASRI